MGSEIQKTRPAVIVSNDTGNQYSSRFGYVFRRVMHQQQFEIIDLENTQKAAQALAEADKVCTGVCTKTYFAEEGIIAMSLWA